MLKKPIISKASKCYNKETLTNVDIAYVPQNNTKVQFLS